MKTHRKASRFILFVSLFVLLVWAPDRVSAQPETLTIAAANSLKDALRKLLPVFEAQYPEVNVRIIYGPSQSENRLRKARLLTCFCHRSRMKSTSSSTRGW